MAYNVRIMDRAEQDLSEIVTYFADKLCNPKAAERQSTSCGTTSSTLQVFFHSISAFPYFHAWIFHVCKKFFFIQTMAPEGAELIKHIPAFKKESLISGHKCLKLSHSNAFHLKSPLFSGTGLPMKENIKIPGKS